MQDNVWDSDSLAMRHEIPNAWRTIRLAGSRMRRPWEFLRRDLSMVGTPDRRSRQRHVLSPSCCWSRCPTLLPSCFSLALSMGMILLLGHISYQLSEVTYVRPRRPMPISSTNVLIIVRMGLPIGPIAPPTAAPPHDAASPATLASRNVAGPL